jgi:eukaryotic-like serine/threonine-protein kinase
MFTTTREDLTPTLSPRQKSESAVANELLSHYESVLKEKRINWTAHLHLKKVLGRGGQGVVFLSEQKGADRFTLPVALKVFSPERFTSAAQYHEAMSRMAYMAARVARIQHDNLISVHNFVDRDRIRMMVMEWVEGFDLREIMSRKLLELYRLNVDEKRWEYLNRVIATEGPVHPRLKPGVAVAIVRDCLAALAALHREGIIHGDIKPGNIMLKRTGHAKIIDIGSAYEMDDPPPQRSCTPAYAPVEILDGEPASPRSDLASLGYVLIELLAGKPLVSGEPSFAELVESKRTLPTRLESILPTEVVSSELLFNFCRRLIMADPSQRFPSAEEAELRQGGAAAFHRQLIKGDLASEYDNEIRIWLDELSEFSGE